MEILEEFRGRRYYQDNLGESIDIEKHKGKTLLITGKDVPRAARSCNMGDISRSVRAVCCEIEGDENALEDEECMEIFSDIYKKMKLGDGISFLSSEPESWPFKSEKLLLDMDDFSELEITRYVHKAGERIYYLDVEVDRDPNNPEDVITKMYRVKSPRGAGCRKFLYEWHSCQVPKEKYKKMLMKAIDILNSSEPIDAF